MAKTNLTPQEWPATWPVMPHKRRRTRKQSFWRWVRTVLILLLLIPPVYGAALVSAIYWQARTDQTQPVDAIVVLGAAQYNGRPSPVLQARLDRALEVYRAGLAPLVIVTGGRQPGDAYTEAEASRNYLVDRGIPDDAILLENQGTNTWRSLEGVATMVKARGLRRVLFVSDGFHLFRVKLMARDLGLTGYGTAAGGSPIKGGQELSYALREAAAVTGYLLGRR